MRSAMVWSPYQDDASVSRSFLPLIVSIRRRMRSRSLLKHRVLQERLSKPSKFREFHDSSFFRWVRESSWRLWGRKVVKCKEHHKRWEIPMTESVRSGRGGYSRCIPKYSTLSIIFITNTSDLRLLRLFSLLVDAIHSFIEKISSRCISRLGWVSYSFFANEKPDCCYFEIFINILQCYEEISSWYIKVMFKLT